MDELLEQLRSRFSEPLADGRTIVLRLQPMEPISRIVVTVRGYGSPKILAFILPSGSACIVV
jgi:hypothetical protein